jgi:two-component system, NarL family, sensor histidine kinase DesK
VLVAELAGARAALAAAGIEADLPEPPDRLPAERQDVFGWAVREGVTNVVRHSGASRCRISIADDRIEITDDGSGPAQEAGRPPGNGLTGLRERAGAVGGVVTVGRSAEGGFALRVRVPATLG